MKIKVMFNKSDHYCRYYFYFSIIFENFSLVLMILNAFIYLWNMDFLHLKKVILFPSTLLMVFTWVIKCLSCTNNFLCDQIIFVVMFIAWVWLFSFSCGHKCFFLSDNSSSILLFVLTFKIFSLVQNKGAN